MNYVMCSGGLGNQMFQYAFYCAMKEKNRNVAFDTSFYHLRSEHNGFELQRCFGINDYVCEMRNVSRMNRLAYKLAIRLRRGYLFGTRIERIGHYISDIDTDNSIIYGYWQSELFFAEIAEALRRQYHFVSISDRNSALAETMQKEESVAVHVRRGDYLNAPAYINLTDTGYYQKAIAYLRKIHHDLRFYVFSDDPEWCKGSGIFPAVSAYIDWNQGTNSYQDMYLMKSARHMIIANSTFSWWAAYLGNHVNVLRPSVYKRDWDKAKTDMYFCKSWVPIEVGEA